jgi:hypothetical protein
MAALDYKMQGGNLKLQALVHSQTYFSSSDSMSVSSLKTIGSLRMMQSGALKKSQWGHSDDTLTKDFFS